MNPLVPAIFSGFSIWYSYLSLPAGLVPFGVWAAATIITFIVVRLRKPKSGST